MPVYRITLESTGAMFDASGDGSLLDAAERAGIALPSSCRNGSCRTCIHALRSGAIDYAIEWPGSRAKRRPQAWSFRASRCPVRISCWRPPKAGARAG